MRSAPPLSRPKGLPGLMTVMGWGNPWPKHSRDYGSSRPLLRYLFFPFFCVGTDAAIVMGRRFRAPGISSPSRQNTKECIIYLRIECKRRSINKVKSFVSLSIWKWLIQLDWILWGKKKKKNFFFYIRRADNSNECCCDGNVGTCTEWDPKELREKKAAVEMSVVDS